MLSSLAGKDFDQLPRQIQCGLGIFDLILVTGRIENALLVSEDKL